MKSYRNNISNISVYLIQVVAVAARNKDNARKLAALTGTKTVYGSYDELAKDPNAGK